MKEIMISMGNHVTTDNLKLGGEFTVAFATKKTMVASDFVGIVSAKNDPKKMEKTGWSIEKATMVRRHRLGCHNDFRTRGHRHCC